jgi:hypothetical protein
MSNTCRWAAICEWAGCATLCESCGFERGRWMESGFQIAGTPYAECAHCRYLSEEGFYQCELCERSGDSAPSRYERVGEREERRTR